MTSSWVRIALLLLLLLAKKQMAVLWLSHQPQTMLAQAQHTHTHTKTYSSVFVCVTFGRLPCAHAIVLPFAVGKSSNFSKPQNKKHISYYKSSDPRAKKICYNPLACHQTPPARIPPAYPYPAVYFPCVYLICICASVRASVCVSVWTLYSCPILLLWACNEFVSRLNNQMFRAT